jgi:hypothetical protein
MILSVATALFAVACVPTPVPIPTATASAAPRLVVWGCNYDGDGECVVGLLNLDDGRLKEVDRFHGVPFDGRLSWSPDGLFFTYTAFILGEQDFSVYAASGAERFEDRGAAVSWTADGSHLVVHSKYGPNLNPYDVFSLYKTGTWEQICSICRDDPRASECPRPYDALPACSSAQADSAFAAISSNILTSGHTLDGHQVVLQEGRLRVIDVQTGAEKLYEMAGYQIRAFAFAPVTK